MRNMKKNKKGVFFLIPFWGVALILLAIIVPSVLLALDHFKTVKEVANLDPIPTTCTEMEGSVKCMRYWNWDDFKNFDQQIRASTGKTPTYKIQVDGSTQCLTYSQALSIAKEKTHDILVTNPYEYYTTKDCREECNPGDLGCGTIPPPVPDPVPIICPPWYSINGIKIIPNILCEWKLAITSWFMDIAFWVAILGGLAALILGLPLVRELLFNGKDAMPWDLLVTAGVAVLIGLIIYNLLWVGLGILAVYLYARNHVEKIKIKIPGKG